MSGFPKPSRKRNLRRSQLRKFSKNSATAGGGSDFTDTTGASNPTIARGIRGAVSAASAASTGRAGSTGSAVRDMVSVELRARGHGGARRLARAAALRLHRPGLCAPVPDIAGASGGLASGAVDAPVWWDVFSDRTVCNAVQLFASPDCSGAAVAKYPFAGYMSPIKLRASVKSIRCVISASRCCHLCPSADMPAPSADMPAPSADMPAPSADMPAPIADMPAPIADMPAPFADMPAPFAAIHASSPHASQSIPLPIPLTPSLSPILRCDYVIQTTSASVPGARNTPHASRPTITGGWRASPPRAIVTIHSFVTWLARPDFQHATIPLVHRFPSCRYALLPHHTIPTPSPTCARHPFTMRPFPCDYVSKPINPPSHAPLPCSPPMRPSHAPLPCAPPMHPPSVYVTHASLPIPLNPCLSPHLTNPMPLPSSISPHASPLILP
ncbi:unnamed protein product [Closterium sp. NIES-65]|nr:unnamed protein product [Closterium sp. NIES-65]